MPDHTPVCVLLCIPSSDPAPVCHSCVALFSYSSHLSLLSQECRGANVFGQAEQRVHSAVTTTHAAFCHKPYPHSRHTLSTLSLTRAVLCAGHICIEGECYVLPKPRQLLLLAVCIAYKTAFIRGHLLLLSV